MKNIYAYTAPTGYASYPPYISVNEHVDGVEITVRAAPSGLQCGPSASITLTREQFTDLIARGSQP